MSELIMTMSDEEEHPPPVGARKRSQPKVMDSEGGAAADDGSGSDSDSDDGSEDNDSHTVVEDESDEDEDEDNSDDGDGSDEDDESGEDDESFKFGGSFHFEASDSDSEEEVVHAWDLSDARAAAVQTTRGTNLRAKIDATLRRKGPSIQDVPAEDTAVTEAQAADDAEAVKPVFAKARKKQQAKALKALAASARRGGESTNDDAVLTAQPNVQHSGKGWNELALSRPLLRAVKDLGFTNPTPIQAQAIPLALQGRDISGAAVTGSGKTAAFILPVLERLIYRPRRVAATRVLVITPTRELAVQIHAMTSGLGRHTDVRVAMAVGGLSLQTQETSLRTRPDVVVATPGRMIDLIRNSNSISMDDLEILILDEADRLLDLGFQDEVEELVKLCPRGRQTMLFSATMSANVKTLASLSLNNPAEVRTEALYSTAGGLRQQFVRLKKGQDTPLSREAVLLALCTRSFKTKTIVFFRSKKQTHRTTILFGLMGLNAGELHGNLTQLQRLEALEAFRDGQVDFLLATDLAARGLDILGCDHVVNFDLPTDLKDYVHRVGRTARAGRRGLAVSLVGERERPLLRTIAKYAKSGAKGGQNGDEGAVTALASAGMQARSIPPEVVDHFIGRVRDAADDIKDIEKQERTEKELRVAEMETNKAMNLLKHSKEIHSRPARTWFQDEKEKKNVVKKWREDQDQQLRGKGGAWAEEKSDEPDGKKKKKTRGEAKQAKFAAEREAQQAERGKEEYQQKFYLARAKAAAKRQKSGMRGEIDENLQKRKKTKKAKQDAPKPSYEATAKVRNDASRAFASDNGAPRQKKQKDARKVGSGFKSKKRFKRR